MSWSSHSRHTTLSQHWFNVDLTSWRWINVESTLCACLGGYCMHLYNPFHLLYQETSPSKTADSWYFNWKKGLQSLFDAHITARQLLCSTPFRKVRHNSRIESWLGSMLAALRILLCTKKLHFASRNWRMAISSVACEFSPIKIH